MGSATVQGQLWGTLATDWAAYGEQIGLPLQRAPRSTPRTSRRARDCSMLAAAQGSSRCWRTCVVHG